MNQQAIFGILSKVNSNGKIKGSIAFFIGFGLVVGALFLFLGHRELSPDVSVLPASAALQHKAEPEIFYPSVRMGGVEIPVELATTSAAVQKGLSGRLPLEPGKGILFIFNRPDRYRFWMPDMSFPIDIVWIDNGQVVDADENVSPKFDPLHPIFYTPARPVRYVLEVNAGFMKRNNIRVGDPVTFHHIR